MKKTKFRLKRIKIVWMVALIAILAFAADSYAKEKKHGDQLVIEKKDRQIIKGELLAVKESKLIIMESVSLSGVTLDIDDLITIQIAKKSKFFQGLGYGLLTGAGSGALIGFLSGDDSSGWFRMTAGQKALMGGLALGILGAPIGGIWGAVKGVDETVDLEGRSSDEIKSILKKLNSKSRFPVEVPEDFVSLSSMVHKKDPKTVKKTILPKNQIRYEKEHDQKLTSSAFSRVHITVEPGYFKSQGIDDFKGIFKNIGFGEDDSYSGFFGSGVIKYPDVGKNPIIYLKNARIEYSFSKKIALGFTFSPLRKHGVVGRKHINESTYYFSDIYILGEYGGNAYCMNIAYMPIPDAFLKKSSFKVGIGIGLSAINLNFKTSEWRYSEGKGENVSFSKNGLALTAFGEYDYYFNRHLSFGINIDYKYVPVKIEAFQLTGYYKYWDKRHNLVYDSMIIDFPKKRVNFGGYGIGINFGFHF